MTIRQMRAGTKARNDRSGSAIVAALIVVTVVAVLCVAYLQLSMSKSREQRSSVDAKRAFYMAEAGLAEAYAGLVAGKSGNVANSIIPARFANGAFWVEATDEGEGRRTLMSTGMCGTGRSALSIVVENVPEALGALGVFGDQGLTIGQGVTIDGYDSRRGTYESQHPAAVGGGGGGGLGGLVGGVVGGVGGVLGAPQTPGSRVGCNADIVLPGGRLETYIEGDAQPGPDGSVERGSGVTITGSTAPRSAAASLPALEVPALAAAGDINHANTRAALVISPQESSYGSLHVHGGATAVIVGPATLVFDELTLDAGAILTVNAANGPVKIYVREYLNMVALSKYTSASHDPTDVSLLVAASQSVDRDRDGIPDPPVRIESSGSFYGSIYAPQAALSLPASLELYGAVTAQQLIIGDGAKLHFDRALTDAQDDSGALPRMLCWRLVELPDVPLVRMRLDPLSVLQLSGVTPPLAKDAHIDNGDDPLAGVVGVVLKILKTAR